MASRQATASVPGPATTPAAFFFSRAQRVVATQPGRIAAQPQGQRVHEPFHGEAGLHHAESPEGAAHGIVGIGAKSLDAGVGDAVRPAGVFQGQGHDFTTEMGVGSGIEMHGAGQGAKPAVARGSEAQVNGGGVALVAGDKGFLPAPDHFHPAAAGVYRGQGQQALHRGAVLAAEPAAEIRRADTDAPGIEAQGGGDLEAVAKRGLGGDDHVEDAGGSQPGHAVWQFQEDVVLHGGAKRPLDDNRTARHGGWRIAFFHQPVGEQVAAFAVGVDDRGVGSRAEAGSNTPGSGVNEASMRESATARASRVSATTRARASPRWRTRCPQSTGWSLWTMPWRLLPGTSARVSTATTPAVSRAAATSRSVSSPWGMPARLTPAHRQPGGVQSAL